MNLKRIMCIILTLIILIVGFGIVDYKLVENGKKPIFVYRKINVTNLFVNVNGFNDAGIEQKEGMQYIGIGYKVLNCDNDTNKYKFTIGYKEQMNCLTELTCTNKNDDENYTYYYEFFNDKLIRVTNNYILSNEIVEADDYDEEKILKLNEVSGCNVKIDKNKKNGYEIIESCNLSKAQSELLVDIFLIPTSSFTNISTTKEDIIVYYTNYLTCK